MSQTLCLLLLYSGNSWLFTATCNYSYNFKLGKSLLSFVKQLNCLIKFNEIIKKSTRMCSCEFATLCQLKVQINCNNLICLTIYLVLKDDTLLLLLLLYQFFSQCICAPRSSTACYHLLSETVECAAPAPVCAAAASATALISAVDKDLPDTARYQQHSEPRERERERNEED